MEGTGNWKELVEMENFGIWKVSWKLLVGLEKFGNLAEKERTVRSLRERTAQTKSS
jgi:hypothetical protein